MMEADWTQDELVPPNRGGSLNDCFNAESMLGSVLLHLGVVLTVFYFATAPSGIRHDEGVVVDLSELTLPDQRSSTPAAEAAAESVKPNEVAAQDEAVQVPTEEAAASVEDLERAADSEAQEPAARTEPPAEESPPAADAAAEPAAAPAFPEPSGPHLHGAYDPFEVYKAMVAQRVLDVTASSRELLAKAFFSGKLAVHIFLDESGRHRDLPQICPEHSKVYASTQAPREMARRHFEVLKREVVRALYQAAPYPPLPEGVQRPEMMTFFLDLVPPPPPSG